MLVLPDTLGNRCVSGTIPAGSFRARSAGGTFDRSETGSDEIGAGCSAVVGS